jgi:endonuclease VIII
MISVRMPRTSAGDVPRYSPRVPEGDTIHRIAIRLGPRLIGKQLERVTTQGLVRDLAGRTVGSVTAHGKHLVIELDNGTAIRAHLGMYGRFRHYTRAEGDALLAKLSPGRVNLAITTDDGVYLWIGAKTIEIAARRAPMRNQAIAALGPDVLGDGFDSRQAASRAAVHATRTIGEVLLDQRVASGIGNIYKSETLFAVGIDPRTLVGALDEDRLAAIYATARDIMLEKLDPAPRYDYFVYSRTHQPCRTCGTPIACYSLGDPARWTWSCPQCQSDAARRGVSR